MTNISHILVAVDQFPQSAPALARAVELGRAHDAKVTLIHIAGVPDAQYTDKIDRHLVEQQALLCARERIDDALRTHDLGPRKIDIRIETGAAAARVVDISKQLGVDLVVLMAHERRSILEKLVGSTADRIIRATPLPVLIVKRPVECSYRSVVVAVDFSAISDASATLAADLCAGSGLQFVHVTHVSAQFEQIMQRAGSSSAKIASFRQTLADQAGDRLRQLARRFAGRKPAPSTRVINGNPVEALVNLTNNASVDLIAVGQNEGGAIRRALLGGLTQRLLRDATCDILICRPSPVLAES